MQYQFFLFTEVPYSYVSYRRHLNSNIHLVVQGLKSNSWIRLHQRDKDRSKFRVPACELNRKGGEDELEVTPILIVSRTEKRSPELTIRVHPLRDGLRDRALPRPSQPVQPEDGGLVEISRPEFDPVQDSSAGSLQTTFAIAMPPVSLQYTAETIEGDRFSY